jgi:hypothetical protein
MPKSLQHDPSLVDDGYEGVGCEFGPRRFSGTELSSFLTDPLDDGVHRRGSRSNVLAAAE